jgi:RimJ/RimL family protein N-acetyltransferase
MRLFEGLGFKREGILHQYVWKDSSYQDELLYCLLKNPP